MDDQVEAVLLLYRLTKAVHLLEFPGGIDMEELEGELPGVKRLQREVEHHRRVLANGVQHHGVVELGGDLTDDVDALGFEGLQVSERVGVHAAGLISLRLWTCVCFMRESTGAGASDRPASHDEPFELVRG